MKAILIECLFCKELEAKIRSNFAAASLQRDQIVKNKCEYCGWTVGKIHLISSPEKLVRAQYA